MTKEELLRIAKPIIFNQEMVEAIEEGRKTVTRRLIKHPVVISPHPHPQAHQYAWPETIIEALCRPPYRPGDLLYVRETWTFWPCIVCRGQAACGKAPVTYEDRDSVSEGCWIYRAETEPLMRGCITWHPSIHMPKEAARLFLMVTSAWPERLQDINVTECVMEGIPETSLLEMGVEFTRGQFADLWDSTVTPDKLATCGWDANPWVWRIGLERIYPEEEKA